MAKIPDPSKLLPSAKVSSSIVRVSKSSAVKFSAKSVALSIESLRRKRVQETSDISGQLVKIGNFFKIDLENSKKKAEKKRKEKEKEDFSEAEKKLETPKIKGFKFPKMNFPAKGLLERIKKFLFFTAVGWLLPKLIELIPKLEGVLKLITGTYLFVENVFNGLLDGFSSLVKFGGDLKNKTIGFLAATKGGNYQKEFDKLESQFNNFVNLSIVAGLLGTDIAISGINEYNKWRKKNAEIGKPKEPEARKPGTKAAGKVTIGRGGERGLGKRTEVTTGKGGKVPSWWNKIFKGPLSKLKKPFSRFLGVAVPGAGAAFGAIDAKIRFDSGDRLGGTLASISAALDAGTAIAALSVAGLPIAGVLGTISMGIDVLLLIRDILRIFRVPDKFPGFSRGGRVVRKYQGGGNTRGGRPVGRPSRRTLTPAKRKPLKITPQKSQPGKDVGGKKEIEILYPDSKKKLTKEEWIKKNSPGSYETYLRHYQKTVNRPNPYKALTSASQSFKDLPAGLGHIVGAAIDSTLGQKVDIKRAIQQFSYGMSYLAENYANQRVNMSMSSLARDVNVFADGGYVPPSREMRRTNEMANFGEMLSRVLEPAISLKIDEVIQNVKKEINKKGTKEDKEPETGGPGVGGGIESIDISGMSAEDVDALGRMVQAESGGESDIGKAAVLAVILNRYRLIRSGKVSPGEFSVVSKPKDQITIRDILFARNQFSPIKDGRFAGTSSESGKTALASAIRMGGNDPQKLRENLISVGKLSESDADYIVRSVFFSAPGSRASIPGGRAREVLIGRHSFQQSGSSRLLGRIETIGANVVLQDNLQMGSLTGVALRETSQYGWRWGRIHAGIDLQAASGWKDTDHLPVVIKKEGVVIESGINNNLGIVGVRHSDGSITRYVHLNQIKVETNSTVRPGQVLGRIAALGEPGIGNATGPHLHFEYYPPGSSSAVDPRNIYRNFVSLGGRITAPSSDPLSPTPPPQPSRPYPPRPGAQASRQGTIPSNSSLNASNMSFENLKRAIINIQPGQKIVFSGVGSVQGGKNLIGQPVTKYFDRDGKDIGEREFAKRFKNSKLYNDMQRRGYQKGGLIAPSTSRLPIPNSFASYEHPDSRMMIAIQPIIIEKTIPTSSSGNSPIAFPILVGVNNNNLDSYRG